MCRGFDHIDMFFKENKSFLKIESDACLDVECKWFLCPDVFRLIAVEVISGVRVKIQSGMLGQVELDAEAEGG